MAEAVNNTNKKLSIAELLTRKLPAMVVPGKYENVVIKSKTIYPKTETNKQEFVRFTFKIADGREISDNRFEQGLNVMISQLREQLKLQEQEIDVAELLKEDNHKFTIWVTRDKIFDGQTTKFYTNIHFLEPINSTVPEKKEENKQEEVVDTKGDEIPE